MLEPSSHPVTSYPLVHRHEGTRLDGDEVGEDGGEKDSRAENQEVGTPHRRGIVHEAEEDAHDEDDQGEEEFDA